MYSHFKAVFFYFVQTTIFGA